MAHNLTGSMALPVGLVGRQTGTPAADVTIWSYRNTGTKLQALRRVKLLATFDGTAAASTALYRICRISVATPTGGTAVVGECKNVGKALPTYDAREAVAGVSTTGVTFGAGFAVLPCQRQVSATAELDLDYPRTDEDEFLLAPGEGVAIRLSAAGVIGDCLAGSIEIAYLS